MVGDQIRTPIGDHSQSRHVSRAPKVGILEDRSCTSSRPFAELIAFITAPMIAPAQHRGRLGQRGTQRRDQSGGRLDRQQVGFRKIPVVVGWTETIHY
jgi:hypothetical protein